MASPTIRFRGSEELEQAIEARAAKEARTASEVVRAVVERDFLGTAPARTEEAAYSAQIEGYEVVAPPEWEKANTSLKHEIRRLEAELADARQEKPAAPLVGTLDQWALPSPLVSEVEAAARAGALSPADVVAAAFEAWQADDREPMTMERPRTALERVMNPDMQARQAKMNEAKYGKKK